MSETLFAGDQNRTTTGQIVFKNTFFITLGKIALKALTFLFNVFVVRRLGEDHFGQYSIVLAFVGLFQIFFELGMSQYVMREIAQDRDKVQDLFWNLASIRFLLAILGCILLPLCAVIVGYASGLILGIFIYTCGFVLYAFLAPLNTVLTANERLDYVTALTVVGQLVFVVLGALFLLNGWGFISLIVANLMGVPLQIALAVWVIRKHSMASLAVRIEPRRWLALIKASLPFGITSLTLTIAFSIDTLMLKMYHPNRIVGWYNVAYNLIFSLLFFSSGFKEAIVPSLSRAYVQDPKQVERWYFRSVKFIAILSLPVAVGGMLVAFPLIRFLYTDEFLPSALALQILIWDVPLLMFSSFCGNMTTVIGEERAAARIYTINAVANVILNLYAIPRFGLIGASLVTVVTDLIGSLQFYFLLRRKLNLQNVSSVFGRTLIAATLMGLAVALVDHQNLFLSIGVGVVVYTGLVLALRLIDGTEWNLVLRLLSGRKEAH